MFLKVVLYIVYFLFSVLIMAVFGAIGWSSVKIVKYMLWSYNTKWKKKD